MSNFGFLIHEIRSSKFFLEVNLGIKKLLLPRASLFLLVLPFLLLLPSLNLFPYPASGSQFSDLAISHYPNALFLKESLLTHKQIPLWSSTILSGYPFAANPLSGLWYPPGWLIIFMPLPLGFNLLIGIHLIFGGFGLLYLMREEGLGHAGSLFSGLAFALLPKLFSHYGAGHLTLLYAIPWTPWLLWAQQVYTKPKSEGIRFRVPPGLFLSMILLADVRWGGVAFILWWAYSIFHRTEKINKWILNMSIQSILGLLLAAPLLIPLGEYSLISTRSMLGPEDVLVYSLPVLNLLGLFFPNGEGLHEWVLYSGSMVILLAALSLIVRIRDRNRLFWVGVFLISTIIALGSEIPGSEFVASLPLVSLFRVPSRALFLTGFSLAALAGYGLESIFSSKNKDISKKINILLLLASGISISLALGFFFLYGNIPQGVIWGTLGLVLSSVWIWLGVNIKNVPNIVWLSGIFILAVIDLGGVDLNSFQGKPDSKVLKEGEAVAEYLSQQSGIFRTYSPSYSLPQQTSIRYDIQLADGVDPLQLANYVNFMDDAMGVPRNGYTVTVPPYANGNPDTDNISYTPDAEKLGLLNVGYVISEFELKAPDLSLVKKIQGSYIYKNKKSLPRAWMSKKVDQIEYESSVDILELNPNRVGLAASGPGRLTLSEIYYPGWQVRVDRESKPILIEHGLLMAVDLEPGFHEIEFTFRPRSIGIGLLLFIIGLTGLVINITRSKQAIH